MINPTHMDEHVTLLRDVEVITIPFGTKTNLKNAMKGLDISEIPDDQMLQKRGW